MDGPILRGNCRAVRARLQVAVQPLRVRRRKLAVDRRGRFVRTLNLPEGLEADKATATFEDGILTLRVPKAEQVKPRQIRIATEQARPAGDGQHEKPATVGAK